MEKSSDKPIIRNATRIAKQTYKTATNAKLEVVQTNPTQYEVRLRPGPASSLAKKKEVETDRAFDIQKENEEAKAADQLAARSPV